MLKELFPIRHVVGFISSLLLTAAALSVLVFDLPFGVDMGILIVTAVLQASLQLFLFMHIGEEKTTKTTLYLNIAYALFVGLVTIFGTLYIFVWGWYS
ncbi:cytochrome aa3 quinol oxidase subunit IV [Gorillibacterium sp. CAU 1737]|uniref:cytochrome aa3 quinol oxidase subunit IV n=1 Tax=Gorillibacterium sp. CAU 1737 TaxID=3140362 RepID=UPI0032606308